MAFASLNALEPEKLKSPQTIGVLLLLVNQVALVWVLSIFARSLLSVLDPQFM